MSEKKHVVIAIGGPGLFKGCDKAHDQGWTNYLVPMQLAVEKGWLGQGADEDVHWLVFEPAYRERWDDDKTHPVRKTKTEDVLKKKAKHYYNRIEHIASKSKITLRKLSVPGDFWAYLEKLPDGSLSRVWYCGHASGDGLALSLDHSATCVALVKNVIRRTDIAIHDLRPKFTSNAKSSKFYGCFTSEFARAWMTRYGVPAEGAVNKIDFSVIDQPSTVPNVLRRLEKSISDTNWTKHVPP